MNFEFKNLSSVKNQEGNFPKEKNEPFFLFRKSSKLLNLAIFLSAFSLSQAQQRPTQDTFPTPITVPLSDSAKSEIRDAYQKYQQVYDIQEQEKSIEYGYKEAHALGNQIFQLSRSLEDPEITMDSVKQQLALVLEKVDGYGRDTIKSKDFQNDEGTRYVDLVLLCKLKTEIDSSVSKDEYVEKSNSKSAEKELDESLSDASFAIRKAEVESVLFVIENLKNEYGKIGTPQESEIDYTKYPDDAKKYISDITSILDLWLIDVCSDNDKYNGEKAEEFSRGIMRLQDLQIKLKDAINNFENAKRDNSGIEAFEDLTIALNCINGTKGKVSSFSRAYLDNAPIREARLGDLRSATDSSSFRGTASDILTYSVEVYCVDVLNSTLKAPLEFVDKYGENEKYKHVISEIRKGIDTCFQETYNYVEKTKLSVQDIEKDKKITTHGLSDYIAPNMTRIRNVLNCKNWQELKATFIKNKYKFNDISTGS